MRKWKQKNLIPPLKLYVFALSSPPLSFKNGFLTTNCIFCIPPPPHPTPTDHFFFENFLSPTSISFLSFFFFQAAHIGSHWEMFYKKSVLQLCENQSKNTCKGVQFFVKDAGFKSTTLLKLNSFKGISHRSWTQMQLHTLQISYFK